MGNDRETERGNQCIRCGEREGEHDLVKQPRVQQLGESLCNRCYNIYLGQRDDPGECVLCDNNARVGLHRQKSHSEHQYYERLLCVPHYNRLAGDQP